MNSAWASGIIFGQPPHSSFTKHMNRFNTLQRAPRRSERAVALGQPDSLFHFEAAFGQHLGDIFVCQWIAHIPPHRQQDRLGLVLTSFEWIGGRGRRYVHVCSRILSRIRKLQIAVRRVSPASNTEQNRIDSLPLITVLALRCSLLNRLTCTADC